MAGRHFYEVFRARAVSGAPASGTWTWQRIGRAGAPVAHGDFYPTLPECFAALKENRTELGMAPVHIDLAGASLEEASAVVAVSVGEHDVTITSTDPGPSPKFA